MAAPLDEARTACLALLEVRLLHLGEDYSGELHDDARGDVRADAEHHDGELREPAAREDVQEAEELVIGEEGRERVVVDAWYWDSGKEAEDRDSAEYENDPRADGAVGEYDMCLMEEGVKH
jgi:hypothetical protein